MTKRTSALTQVMATGIDGIIGAYIVAVLLRIVVPAVFLDRTASPFGMVDTIAVAAGALVTMLLGLFTGASLGRAALHAGLPSGGWRRSVVQHLGWILFVLTVIAGWVQTRIDPTALFSGQGLEGAGRIFSALLSPEFDILGEALAAMMETIYLAFMATAIAVPFSFLLSFASARTLMRRTPGHRAVYLLLRFVTNFSRSIEPLIWAIVFSVWVGIGPFAGMLALVVHTIASLTKQYAEQIEDVDHGPMEAIETTGAHRSAVIWYSVVPQCVIPFLSFTIYRWDINVRMATIIGLVGGGGIGNMLIQYQGLAQWNEVGAIVLLIALVVWVMDVISSRVREALK